MDTFRSRKRKFDDGEEGERDITSPSTDIAKHTKYAIPGPSWKKEGNQRNWRDRDQSDSSRGTGRGRDGGRGRGLHYSDGNVGAGGSRDQSTSGGRDGYSHSRSGGSWGAGSSRDQSTSGGRDGYSHSRSGGSWGAGSSRGQFHRNDGEEGVRGRGGARGRGRGRGGANNADPVPVEVFLDLPSYAAFKIDVKRYQIDEKQLEIPSRTGIKSNSRYFHTQNNLIEVNYLPIIYTKPEKMQLFHYDVKIDPDVPKYMLRSVMKEMERRYYSGRHPAFDGERNLYAAGTPLFEGKTIETGKENKIQVFNTNSEKEVGFQVTITIANPDLNVNNILTYLKAGSSLRRPIEVQALEIALKGNLAMRFLPVGKRAFYPSSGEFTRLSAGMELRHGIFQGTVLADKSYLNVDVAHKGFPISQPVIKYLQNKFGQGTIPEVLHASQKDSLGAYLKGLKIQYRDPKPIRVRNYKYRSLSDDADNTKFYYNERMLTVFEYFQIEKNYKIQYRKLPLLNVGTKEDHPVNIPLELCEIMGNQKVMKAYTPDETDVMVRECSDLPPRRKDKVVNNAFRFADLSSQHTVSEINWKPIGDANYNRDPVLREEFGIQVGSNFTCVNSMLLRSPNLIYANGHAEVKDGVWRSRKLNTPMRLSNWVILDKQRDAESDQILQYFVHKLQEQGALLNFRVDNPLYIRGSNSLSKDEIKKDFSYLTQTYKNLQLIWVILPTVQTGPVYGHIKCVSELNEGVLTQCVKWTTLRKMFIKPLTAGTTISNLLLKVNAKLGGVNYTLPDCTDDDTMFVGADVTHPGIGSENPSIATVVGSYDKSGFNYKVTYCVQESRCENIIRMEALMYELLIFYHQRSKKYPSKIYYFRDGVSEGQFEEMKKTELMAIKAAGQKLKIQNFRVTFVVAQKRHHTRFFPVKSNNASKNGNVFAGTVVNTAIVHPKEHDFFLVSHQSIQGTARPTKYHVIHNEIKTPDDEFQSLTYSLCYMFARCTRSVKYPTPTYYAHLAGKRAEHYLKGSVNEEENVINLVARGKIHPNMALTNPMHFI